MTDSPRYAYFDTSALMRLAEGDVATPSSLNTRGRESVSKAITDDEICAAISEHTLLEFSGALTRDVGLGDHPEFDDAWYERSFAAVMEAIASRQISVIPVPSKAAEHAMVLRRAAMNEHGISFQAWDAFHLITSAAWADHLGHPVEFWTGDPDYRRFLDRYPYFASLVTLVELQ